MIIIIIIIFIGLKANKKISKKWLINLINLICGISDKKYVFFYSCILCKFDNNKNNLNQ